MATPAKNVRIRKGSKTYGPFTRGRVVELLNARKVLVTDFASVDDGPWQPLGQLRFTSSMHDGGLVEKRPGSSDAEPEYSEAKPVCDHLLIRPRAVPPPLPVDLQENASNQPAVQVSRVRVREIVATRKAAGLAIVGLCLLAVLILGAWFAFRGEELDRERFLPQNCQLLTVVNLDRIRTSSAYRKLEKAAPDDPDLDKLFRHYVGLELAQISRITIGATLGIEGEAVVIVQSREPIQESAILENKGGKTAFKAVDIGRFRLFEGRDGSFCLPSAKTLVVGKGNALHRVLQRDKPARMAKNLVPLLNQVDLAKGETLVFSLGELRLEQNALGRAGVFVRGTLAERLESAIVEVEWKNRIEGRATVNLTKEQHAEQFQRMLKSAIADLQRAPGVPKALASMLDDLQFSLAGKQITVSLRVDPDAMAALPANDLKGMDSAIFQKAIEVVVGK